MRNERTTRRVILRGGMVMMAAGTAAVAAARVAAAQEKLAKEAVQYQEQPKNGQKCSLCVNYVEPNACNIVAGQINPEGWCVAFGPKSS